MYSQYNRVHIFPLCEVTKLKGRSLGPSEVNPSVLLFCLEELVGAERKQCGFGAGQPNSDRQPERA